MNTCQKTYPTCIIFHETISSDSQRSSQININPVVLKSHRGRALESLQS